MSSLDTQRLRDLQALRPDGSTVELGEFWRHQPVVLTMIRHFG